MVREQFPIPILKIKLKGNYRRMASLNEFRHFFGLKPHETMEDINPDPEIANLLRHLYDSPDMVELYPGLFIEETKPPMSPGNGGCLGKLSFHRS